MAEQNIIVLSPGDELLLQAMLDREKLRNGVVDRPAPFSPPPLPESPEVYIALTPAGGIPAFYPEPGTGSPGSSGSIYGDEFSATCRFLRLAHEAGSTYDTDVVPIGRTETVYNLGTTAVAGNTIILAIRDKWGHWQAIRYDSAGAAGPPGPPGPSGGVFDGCKAYVDTSYAITSGFGFSVDCDAEDFDTSGYHSTVGNKDRLTAPADGYYLVQASVWCNLDISSTLYYLSAQIFRNTSTLLAAAINERGSYTFSPPSSSSPSPVVNLDALVRLTAGEYVRLSGTLYRTISTGSNALKGADGGAARFSTFSITRVGT